MVERTGPARVGRVAQQVGRRAVLDSVAAQPFSRIPARGAERLARRSSRRPAARPPRRRSDRARPSRRRRSRRRSAHRPRARRRRAAGTTRTGRACAWRRSGTWSAASAIPGKFSMLISVGTSAVPCSTISADRLVGEPGAVLDAVDAGVDQAGQRVLAEHVGGDPGPVGVRGVDGRLQHVVGPQRRQVADPAVDPVADELDPAVAPARLLGDLGRQLRFVLDVDRQAADVALGPRDVPARPDDARQVVPVVEAAGVHRRPGSRAAAARPRRVRSRPARSPRRGRWRRARPSPTWQCASTRPGRIQPPSAPNTVSAPATGSADSAPSTIHQSAGSSPGSTRPRTCKGVRRHLVLPGNFSFDRSKSASPGGSSSRPGGICDRSGKPPGMPGAERIAHLRRRRPPVTALLALLALGGLAVGALRPHPACRTGRPSTTSSCGPRRTGPPAG